MAVSKSKRNVAQWQLPQALSTPREHQAWQSFSSKFRTSPNDWPARAWFTRFYQVVLISWLKRIGDVQMGITEHG